MRTQSIPVPIVRQLPGTTQLANLRQGVTNESFLAALSYLETIKSIRPVNRNDIAEAASKLVYLPRVPEKPKSTRTPDLYR